VLFIALLFCCVAIVNAQRSVYAAAIGSGNDRACYVVSAQYAVVPNTSVVGNVFAAAMGINIPGAATPQLYPWTALAYVKGNLDITNFPDNGASNTLAGLSAIHVQAQASVLAWSYAAIGEFCDLNGQKGLQLLSTDYIIEKYFAPQAVNYNMNCARENDPITGDDSYMASIQTGLLGQVFNVTCRVFAQDTSVLRHGRTVTPYDFKCDIRINYTSLWSKDATKINGCSDANRKIGILINVAGAFLDVDASVAQLNTAALNTPDGEHVNYGLGKLRFSWDNYYVKTSTFAATTGTNDIVTATWIGHQTLDGSNSIYGVRVVDQFIFTFDAPKSADTIYYWDPTTTVLDTTASSSLTACLGMVALCFLSFFF